MFNIWTILTILRKQGQFFVVDTQLTSPTSFHAALISSQLLRRLFFFLLSWSTYSWVQLRRSCVYDMVLISFLPLLALLRFHFILLIMIMHQLQAMCALYITLNIAIWSPQTMVIFVLLFSFANFLFCPFGHLACMWLLFAVCKLNGEWSRWVTGVALGKHVVERERERVEIKIKKMWSFARIRG